MDEKPSLVIPDKPANEFRYCGTCHRSRQTYIAGTGGSAAPGSLCCAHCSRVLLPPPIEQATDRRVLIVAADAHGRPRRILRQITAGGRIV